MDYFAWVGPDYPILVKLGIKDYHPEGKSVADGIEQAKLLEIDGVDAIEVSEGSEGDQSHHIRLDAVRPYYLQECTDARKALSRPVILIGGMRNSQEMQAVLDKGIADAISMCRPFIMDPLLVKHFREGSTVARGAPPAISALLSQGEGTYAVLSYDEVGFSGYSTLVPTIHLRRVEGERSEAGN